jgi:hypothetical protein
LDVVNEVQVTLWQRAQDRLFELSTAPGRQLLLNKVADLSSAVFGELCLVQASNLQALLELSASKVQLSNITTAEIFDLTERFAPDGSQFVRGMAYWLAIGDNLFFVKTHSMTSEYLHEYIKWLIRNVEPLRTTAFLFQLKAEFDKSQFSGDIGEIRSLRVSGKMSPQFSVSPPRTDASPRVVDTVRTVADKIAEFAQAVPVVEALFGKPKAESLLKSLGKDEYLTVEAAVKVRGRRTAESRAKLRDIASDLADLTEGKVQVEGKDGKVSDGDAILRTRMPFTLAREGSNLLEFDNVADQPQEVYNRFVKDGKIKAQ